MKANLIKSLKNNAELVDIKAGRSARRNFPGVDFENAVLIINGRIAEPDTIIKDNDIVTLRQIPGDLTDTPWWVATLFIPFGFLIQPAELAYKARQQADEAERELEKIKKLTNNPSIENLPFLRGATNSIATGKSQPYFCGRNLLTPYLFSQPYYKISGEDGENQFVYNILEGGFKDIVIHKLGLADVDIKEFTDTTPQNDAYYIDSGLFADGVIEIRQDGEPFDILTELNKKCISSVVNAAIPPDYKVIAGDDERTIFTLDPAAKSVDICINFPYGLYKYDSENKRVSASVDIIPEYSLDGGLTWTAFTFPSGNTFTKNTTKSLRYVAHKDFNLNTYFELDRQGQKSILVRVRSEAENDETIRADCYTYFYQQIIFDPLKSSTPAGVLNDSGTAGLVDCLNVEDRERAYGCVIGLVLKATKSNEKKLSQINIIATSTARTWSNGAWSETKSPTRNPAAIALEILTSDTHQASRYDDSEIDLDAFGTLYEYCENNDIYFDDIITQGQKKDAELQKIADVCGCAFYKDIYGRRSVAIDTYQNTVIAAYNSENIINLTHKKTFARRVDALRIRYIDSENDTYKQNTYTVTRLENGQPVTIDENSIIKEITAAGITRHSQIVKYARRLMAIDELRPITSTLKIGAEGVYFTPYSLILIQDISINRDAQDTLIESCEYQSGLLKKIYLKKYVEFTDPTKAYGIIINIPGSTKADVAALKVEGTGRTKELTVITNYSISNPIPSSGNVATFGQLDINGNFSKIVHQYIITRASRVSDGFTLDLQDYNEAIYNPGVIPAYKPIINNVPTPSAGAIPPDSVTHEELDEAAAAAGNAVQAAVDTIQNGYRFTNIYNVRPVTETLEEIIAKIDDDALNQSASISMSEEEILIKVEDLDSQQRSYIDLTKDEILEEVDDMARELTGLIDIQAGSVMALVEGGGAAGQMSLSLNLPIMIDKNKRAQFIEASDVASVEAVYAPVAGTNYYGIRGDSSNMAIKTLWDAVIAAGLLASQIVLSADQINLAGKTIYTSQKTDIVAQTAQTNAQDYADTAASSAANTAAVSKRADVARALGYLDWAAMETAARNGQTIIDGGYLRTSLIDVQNILTKNITVKDKGALRSVNYNGTIDSNGNITTFGSVGWAIDHAGKSNFTDGVFAGVVTCKALDVTGIKPGNYKLFGLLAAPGISQDTRGDIVVGNVITYVRSGYHQILASGEVNYRANCTIQLTNFTLKSCTLLLYKMNTNKQKSFIRAVEVYNNSLSINENVTISTAEAIYCEIELRATVNEGVNQINFSFSEEGIYTDAPNSIIKYLGNTGVNSEWK